MMRGDINTPVADEPVCSATRLKSAIVFSLMIDGQRLLASIPMSFRGVSQLWLGAAEGVTQHPVAAQGPDDEEVSSSFASFHNSSISSSDAKPRS